MHEWIKCDCINCQEQVLKPITRELEIIEKLGSLGVLIISAPEYIGKFPCPKVKVVVPSITFRCKDCLSEVKIIKEYYHEISSNKMITKIFNMEFGVQEILNCDEIKTKNVIEG